MSKRTKRLAIMGKLPMVSKYLKTPVRLKAWKMLERDGWVLSGEGFADAKMLVGVYRLYHRDELVYVERQAAIPHYSVFSGTPDYWMYGELTKRHYLNYHMADGHVEERGTSYHKSENTMTFQGTPSWDETAAYITGYGFD